MSCLLVVGVRLRQCADLFNGCVYAVLYHRTDDWSAQAVETPKLGFECTGAVLGCAVPSYM